MSIFNQTRRADEAYATYEGGATRKPEAREELALLTVSSVLHDTFYERKEHTALRMQELAGKVEPDYLARLAAVARQEFNMRTGPAALVAASTLNHGQPREELIDSVFLRGDELMDYLGAVSAWSTKGKVTPAAVRYGRKIIHRTLTERKALRYSRQGRKWSLAKAILVTHALSGATPEQAALYSFVINWSRNSMAQAWEMLTEEQRGYLPTVAAAVAGEDEGAISWERSRSAGASWNDVVTGMGYMALLRNLRNFLGDEDFSHWDYVINRIKDPEEVARSKQFPFRFLSAYRSLESSGYYLRDNRNYAKLEDALQEALEHSVSNLPELPGRTLVVVDTSGSMQASLSTDSVVSYVDVAALFGAISAKHHGNADLVAFATTARKLSLRKSNSLLADIGTIQATDVGYGTDLSQVFSEVNVGDYDNILIFSDMQVLDYYGNEGILDGLDTKANVFSINLAAYQPQLDKLGSGNHYSIGGWSDATLRLIDILGSPHGIVGYVEDYKI